MLTRLLATATLVALGLSSPALADYIYTDDGLSVKQFQSNGTQVPPGANCSPLTNPAPFSCTPGTSVKGLAATVFDTSLPGLDILAAAGGNNAIYIYSQTGVQSPFADNTSKNAANVSANLTGVVGITVNGTGDVFAGGNSGMEIEEFSPTGAYIGAVVSSGLEVNSLAVNAAGQLFEADNGTGTINEYTVSSSGTLIGAPSTYSTLPGTSTNYYGMAFDSQGDLYVAYQNTTNSGGIYEIAPGGGTPTTVYSESGFRPIGLSYNPYSGTLYMSYFSGNSGGVDSFTANGSTTITPTTFLASGTLDLPYGIVSPAPEPGTLLLFAVGLTSIFFLRRFLVPKVLAASRR